MHMQTKMMKNKQFKTQENYYFTVINQIIQMITPIIIAPYLSRVLGVEKIGEYSFIQSITSYFVLCSASGTALLGTREIAKSKNDYEKQQLFYDILILRVCSSFLFFALYGIIAFISDSSILYLASGIEIISIVFDISWFYQGIENFKIITICNSVFKIALIIAVFIFVHNSNDLLKYILIYTLTMIFGYLLMWHGLPKNISHNIPKRLNLRSKIKSSWLLFLPVISYHLYSNIDKTMLGLYETSGIENGYYEQGQKLVKMAITIIITINTVMSPKISSLIKENKITEIKKIMKFSFRLIFAMSMPMAVGMFVIVPKFVPMFFGTAYEPCVIIARILTPLFFIIGCNHLISWQYMIPWKKEKTLTFCYVCGIIINIFFNFLLIPKFMSKGAAISSVISELLVLIMMFIFLKKFTDVKIVIKYFIKYLFISFFMGLCGTLILNAISNSIIACTVTIVVCATIYGIILLILKDPVIKFLLFKEEEFDE